MILSLSLSASYEKKLMRKSTKMLELAIIVAKDLGKTGAVVVIAGGTKVAWGQRLV